MGSVVRLPRTRALRRLAGGFSAPFQARLTAGSARIASLSRGLGDAGMKLIGGLALLGLVVILVAVGIAAQRGGRAGSSGSTTIVLEDLRFTPNRIDARVGVPLTVRLTNRGTERHDLNFPSLHMPRLEGIESILEPGETRTITLLFDQSGTHTFICSLPGHAAAGMTGAAFVRS